MKLDFISDGPKLFINKQQTFKTNTGMIFSILTLIFVLSYLYYNGKELFEKQSPIIIERESISDKIYLHNVSQSNFFFMYAISTFDNTFTLDFDRVLDIKVYQYSYSQNETNISYSYNPIDVIYCNQTRNPINFFSKQQLENSFCLTNYDFSLGGTWDDTTFNSFAIDIFLCDNTTRKNCLSYNDQIEVLKDKLFNVYIEADKVNSIKYDDPIVKVMNNIYFQIDINQYKLIEIFYKTVIVQTNKGWLFENKVYNYGIRLDYNYYDNTVILNRSENNKISTILLFSSRKESIYERKYVTIFDIISNLGGLIEIIIISFMMVSNSISKKLMNIKLINTLFEFNDLSRLVFRDNKILKSNLGNMVKHSNSYSNNDFSNKSKIKLNSALINNLVSSKQIKLSFISKNLFQQKQIHLNDCQVLFSKIICTQLRSNYINYTNKLYMKCIEEVYSYCSIDYIILKMREIEYLKFVLLNYEQNISFDYLKRTNILLDDVNIINNSNIFTQNLNRITSMNVLQKKEILEKYFERKDLSKIDRKIMNLIEIIH